MSAVLGGFLVTSAFTNIACGMSPLLNHSNPNRPQSVTQAVNAPQERTCDWYFKSQDLCATYTWVKEPTREEEGSFKLIFFKAGAPAVNAEPIAASVFVKLWMPDMGHGSQKVVTVHSKDSRGNDLPGEFDATEVSFVMSGKWEIFVQLKDSAGKVLDQSKINYTAL